MKSQNPTPDTLLRKPDVAARLGISQSTIQRLEKAGDFPRRVRLGPRAVAWRASEIEDWIADRAAA